MANPKYSSDAGRKFRRKDPGLVGLHHRYLVALLTAFDKSDIPDEPVIIASGSVIMNVDKFIAAHVRYIIQQAGNRHNVAPFLNRLYQLFERGQNLGWIDEGDLFSKESIAA